MSEKLTEKELTRRNGLKEKKPYVYEKMLKINEKYKRGESFAIIQLQYNYACNFTCEHCAIKSFQVTNSKRRMTPEDVRNIAKQADEMGLARFVISGGEPLILNELDEIVKAIDPSKFFINCDTNGWLLDEKMAEHLLEIGVDRIQLSIDSLDAKEHDRFRGKEGAHVRAMAAVEACLKIGLDIYIQTVVTKERLYSEELIEFVEYFNNKGIGVYASYAKPVGAWAGHFDNLVDKNDLSYMTELEKKYKIFNHLTPGYGIDMGCIAVKGMISITQYGDVLPCPFMHISLGNVLDTPLKEIVQTGLDIKFFGEHVDTCLMAEDLDFLKNYIEKKVYDKAAPVSYKEVFDEGDRTKKEKIYGSNI